MNIGFTKMHGLGNDFIIIENMNGRISLSKEQIIFLCDRHKGIGADGVILVEKSDNADSMNSPRADCFMNYYNADGTEAEMCGNGVRCVVKFLKDEILYKVAPLQKDFKIDTRAGVKEVKYEDDGTYSVNMGKPVFTHDDFPAKCPEIKGLTLHLVSIGNPHAVAFVKDLDLYDLPVLGPEIENNKNFPNKINFELVQKMSSKKFKIKVWERGCGATLACGTGACAVYAVARKQKLADKEITIILPGGELFLSGNDNGDIIMRGLAESVYSGIVELK